MVGNGQHLHCDQLCEAVTITIKRIQFVVNLHVLPLCSANVVLGVQWLKTFGPIMTDYSALTMKLFHEGHLFELHGDPNPASILVTSPQLRRIVRKQGVSACFHIAITPSESSLNYQPPTSITSLNPFRPIPHPLS